MPLKTSPKEKQPGKRVTQVFKTTNNPFNSASGGFAWWAQKVEDKRAEELCSTLAYLKTTQQSRLRQLAVFARLYSGQPLFSFIGSNLSMADQSTVLAPNRATYNAIASI